MTPTTHPGRAMPVLALMLAMSLAGCANMSAEQRGTAQGAGTNEAGPVIRILDENEKLKMRFP